MLAPVFIDASIAQKHFIVAGAAAAGLGRVIRDIRSGCERNRGVVIETARADASEPVVASLAIGDLAGIAFGRAAICSFCGGRSKPAWCRRSIGEWQFVAGTIAPY